MGTRVLIVRVCKPGPLIPLSRYLQLLNSVVRDGYDHFVRRLGRLIEEKYDQLRPPVKGQIAWCLDELLTFQVGVCPTVAGFLRVYLSIFACRFKESMVSVVSSCGTFPVGT